MANIDNCDINIDDVKGFLSHGLSRLESTVYSKPFACYPNVDKHRVYITLRCKL